MKGVWFTRLGASQNTLDTKGTLGQLSGFGGYVGTGVEFNFSGIGLAFELAFRKIPSPTEWWSTPARLLLGSTSTSTFEQIRNALAPESLFDHNTTI